MQTKHWGYMGTLPPLGFAVCTRNPDTALGKRLCDFRGWVIVPARHLMGVTVTAGALNSPFSRTRGLEHRVWGVWDSSFFMVALKGHWEMTARGSKPQRCFSFLGVQGRQQVRLEAECWLQTEAALGSAGTLTPQAALQPSQEPVSEPGCKTSLVWCCCIRVRWKSHRVYTDWNDGTPLEQRLAMKAPAGCGAPRSRRKPRSHLIL